MYIFELLVNDMNTPTPLVVLVNLQPGSLRGGGLAPGTRKAVFAKNTS